MKIALVFLVLGVCIATCAAKNCWFDEGACGDEECCVRMTNLIGICKKIKQEGETCGTKVVKQPFKDHVYLMQCPCAEGLTCEKKEGIVGVIAGTCTSGEGTGE